MVELRNKKLLLLGICTCLIVVACRSNTALPTRTEASLSSHDNEQTETETSASIITEPIPTLTVDPAHDNGCGLGLGLRRETFDILLEYKDYPGFVMSSNMQLANSYFPELAGWTRVLGAPSLEGLKEKAVRAKDIGLSFEALSYGLETSVTTPEVEWQHLEESTEKASLLADQFGKLLIMGPGLRLMNDNENSYGPMASRTEIWMIQTQRLQINPPGEIYREEVERIVGLLRAGNSEIMIWAQINFLPDRPPDVEEWIAYRDSIVDLVDGTFIGVYTWDSEDAEVLRDSIRLIFQAVCQGNMEQPQ